MPPDPDRQSSNNEWQNSAEIEPSTSAPVSSPDTTTPVPTTPTPTAAPAGMSIVSSRKPGRKKWLPAIIGAIVVVLLLAGGGVAYALYQRPDNVLVGAFMNGISSKSVTFHGTLSSTAKDSNDTSNPFGALRATFDGKSDGQQAALNATLGTKYNAKDVSLDFSTAVTSNSDLYFKFGKLTQVLSAVSNGDKQVEDLYKPLVDKLDNKWIKITQADLKDMGVQQSDASTKCYQDFSHTLQTDKNEQNKYADLYRQHPFVKVDKQLGNESVNGHDSLHYQLKPDDAEGKKYAEGLKNLDSIKKLESCTNGQFKVDDSTTTTSSDETATAEVWVDTWSHVLTRLKFTGTDSSSTTVFSVEPQFNQLVSVDVPKNSTSIKTLMQDFQKTLNDALLSSGATGTDEIVSD